MQAPGAPTEPSLSNVPATRDHATKGSNAPRNGRRTLHLTRARARRNEHGIAAVEFAIGALLLMLLGFGAWEYGLFLNKGQTLANSVRTAARVTATACIPPSDLDNRVASDPDCLKGNKASDDFQTLRSIQASLGRDWNEVDKILIYKAPGGPENYYRGAGKPPDRCIGPDGEVQSLENWCNRFDETTQFLYEGTNIPLLKNLDKFFYTADEATAKNNADIAAAVALGNPPPTTSVQADDAKVELVNATFDCSSVTSPSAPFCPTKTEVDLATGASIPVRKRGLNASSNVGVYVKLKHNMITGLFGKEQRVAQWSLFRLEPSPYDNTPYSCTGTACDAPPAVPTGTADLAITKTDGLTEAGPNDPLTYTIAVTNNGPNNANGVVITDPNWPVQLVNLGWTCAPLIVCESDAGTILDETVNLAAGQTVTFIWNARVKADVSSMSSTIANTASVGAPANLTDPTPSNNAATDTTSLVKPDLSITKVDDGLSIASPFQPIEYEIEVSNVGEINVTGANINWTLPPQLDLTSWQCISATLGAVCQTVNQTGPFADSVTLPKTGVLRYVLRGTVRVDASGSMNPSATVTLPVGLVDDTPGNNTRADAAETVIIRPDLTIAKDDGKSFIGPLEETEYTIVAQNTGAFRVDGVRIVDNPPAMLNNLTWTCTAPPSNTCPAPSGTGPIDYTTNLAGGSSMTFKLKATAIATASGSITNRAEIIAPAGLLELSTANNIADDVEPNVVRFPVLIATKTDSRTFIAPGMVNTYVITARNNGSVPSKSARIVDNVPVAMTGVTWTCTSATGGTVCPSPATGSGNLNATLDLPPGGQVNFEIVGTLSTSASGTLSNTVTASNDPAISVANAPSSSDTDTTEIKNADLAVTKTVSPTGNVSPGQNVTYTVVYRNDGPGTATGATLTDVAPAGKMTFPSWTCVATGSATCPASPGTGSISSVRDIPEGGRLTFTVTGRVANAATGTITNTAAIAANSSTPEEASDLPNSSASVSNTVILPDLTATLTANPVTGSSVGPKTQIEYTFTVGNVGLGSAPAGVGINVPMPTQMGTFTWTCAATGTAVCPSPSGAGALAETTTDPLPPGSTLVYTITGTLSGTPTIGTMTTTGTAVPPVGMTESGSSSNTASTTHTVAHPDLRMVKTASAAIVGPGQTFKYFLTTTNLGPGTATAVRVVDTFPATLGSVTWGCTGTLGAECTSSAATSSGSGNISTVSGDIPPLGTLVYEVNVTVALSATTSVANTATANYNTSALVDPSTANNSSTITVTIQKPDLRVTKTDGRTQVSPNQTYAYTIVFSNAGPGPVTGVTIADAIPTQIDVVSWACAAAGGATCPALPAGSLNTSVNMPSGSTLTFTLNAKVKAAATGSVANTATITSPVVVGDRDTSNNSATDTDTIVIPDLTVTKTDGIGVGATPGNVAAGQQLTYTIVATNLGPGPVTGARLVDTPPAGLTAVTWSCGSPTGGAVCPAPTSGSGAINITNLDLPAVSSVTYTVIGTVTDSATGSLVQNVTLNHPVGTTDPTPGNNTATDTNTVVVSDLSISKDDDRTNVTSGDVLTYTIVASNAGPGPVVGARIIDTPPASLTGLAWSCIATSGGATCPSPISGTGTLDLIRTLPSSSSLTFRVTGTVAAGLTSGTIVQTVEIRQPAGKTDPTPLNNTATDTDTIVVSDLAISKSDGLTNVGPGQVITYDIVATNNGPGPVANAKLVDTPPASLTGVSWLCDSPTGGAVCPTPTTGTGAINITNLTLPASSSVRYRLTATVAAGATGTITQVATLNHGTAAAVTAETDKTNNSATDTDTVQLPDPNVAKTASSSTRGRGQTFTYTVTVNNAGPGPATNVAVTDTLPVQLATSPVPTWTCSGSACPVASGTGNLSQTIPTLAGGASVVYTLNVRISDTASSGAFTNTASITSSTDRDLTNNSRGVAVTVNSPDLQITKTHSQTTITPGQTFAYTIIARNNGSGSVTGAVIADTTMTNFVATGWTCVASSGATCPAASGTGTTFSVTAPRINSGSTLTFTFTGTVPAAASGNVVNTATITPPTGQNIVESNTGNNSQTSTFAITQPDVAVTKTNNQTQVFPGQALTYDVVVTNTGATTASSVTVADSPPTLLTTGASPWSCAGATGGATCASPGTARNLSVTLATLPAGATVTYRMVGSVSPSAAATIVSTIKLSNMATITSATDDTPANNSATDADNIVHPDLAITKNDTVASVNTVYPRYSGSYTIVARNNGPGPVTGATVTDTIPSGLTGVSWTCAASSGASCPASGTNSINATVNLPLNATATFVVNYTVADSFFGTITNTASIAAPSGFTDPSMSNNSQPDVNESVRANLSIDKNDGNSEVWPGRAYTYSILVSNIGTVPVTGATVTDSIPAELTSGGWSCTGTGGGTCPATGSGGISTSAVNLPVGSTVTFLLNTTVTNTATGSVTNTATVAVPSYTADSAIGNNTDSDIDVITLPDVVVTKGNGVTSLTVGSATTYTITVKNKGPGPATNIAISDIMSSKFNAGSVTWTCNVATGAATGSCGSASGTGNIAQTVSLNANGQINFIVTGTVSLSATGTLVNTVTATLTAPGDRDTTSTGSENSATDTDVLNPVVTTTTTTIATTTTRVFGGT